MATIDRRGQSYRIRVYAGSHNGKPREYSMTWRPPKGMTDRQAEKEVQRQAMMYEERIKTSHSSQMRVADYASLWIDNYATPQLRPRTVARYKELMVRIVDYYGSMRLSDIAPMHIISWLQSLRSDTICTSYICTVDLRRYLQTHNKTKVWLSQASGVSQTTISAMYHRRPVAAKSAIAVSNALGRTLSDLYKPSTTPTTLSDRTVQHYYRLLSVMLTTAVQWQLIPSNPCATVNGPKSAKADITYLDDNQARSLLRLLQQVPGYYRRAITLALLTGLRRGELLGLEWGDVDWTAKTIHIKRTLQYLPGKGVYTDQTKTKTSNRIVMVSDQVIRVLQDQYAWQLLQQQILGDKWTGTGNIITDPAGKPMHPDRLTHWFGRFVGRHLDELPRGLTLHSLRHTYATLCISQGIPLTAVAHQLGHASVATTCRIYAHAIRSAEIAAANAIGNMFCDII